MFYRVNMSTLAVNVDEGKAYRELGGKALCLRILSTEVPSDIHPFSKYNKLVFTIGLLSGTGISGVGRLFLGAKSPLTNTVILSSAGGGMDNKLGRLGIQGIIVEGMPTKKTAYILHISSKRAYIEEAAELNGLNIFATTKMLQNKYGRQVAIGCIGIAGENKLLTACIGFTDWQNSATRQAGRGGLGAVAGSKGLKAIIVDDTGSEKVYVADEKAFAAGGKKLLDSLSALQPKRGTGQFCGSLSSRCLSGCIIPCGKSNNKDDNNGRFSKRNMLSSFLGCDASEFSELCDDCGIDMIEFSKAAHLAVSAGMLKTGDGQTIGDLLDENALLGRVIGSGEEIAARIFGVLPIEAKDKDCNLSSGLELMECLLDTMGFCKFIAAVIKDSPEALTGIVEMCNARYGWQKDLEEYIALSKFVR